MNNVSQRPASASGTSERVGIAVKFANVARTDAPTTALDRALDRVLAEISEGLSHGFFEFRLTSEVIGQERRRLTLHAGKSYQFVIPKEDCVRRVARTLDSCDGSDLND